MRRSPRADVRRPLPRRGRPFRDEAALVLFSCEGAQTEPNYITELCRDLGLALPQFAARGGDPSHVVEEAAARMRSGDYDAVWCVFDRDEHEHFSAALQRAKDLGLGVACSNPCIEVWFLLHYRYSTAYVGRDDAVAECVRLMGGYGKGDTVYDVLRSMQDDAIANARRLRDTYHAQVNRGRLENPSTTVDLMVLALRDLASRR